MHIRIFYISLAACSCLQLLPSCKQTYSPPAIKNNPRFLVVDGLITGSPDSTVITLTRSRNIADSTPAPPELNATVQVEQESGGTFPLIELGNGRYGNLLFPDSAGLYRLVIRTTDGSQYASDYIPFKITPPIDSVGFSQDSANVAILVSTHDPSNNTRYYRWAYEETWQYHTYYTTNFDYVPSGVIVRGWANQIYFCWMTIKSPDIQVGTSTALSQDLIVDEHIHNVSKHSEKINTYYSILVKQYALTRDQFEFWTNLKKTTEQLGTIFDAQPAQLNGNIHCVSSPQEIVLGYLCASTTQRKRIFINRTDLSNFYYIPYTQACAIKEDVTAVISETDSSLIYQYLLAPNHPYTLLYEYNGYHLAENFCADCREHGGTSIQPDFWP
jgi:Domain of unknown function (DUF4249)